MYFANFVSYRRAIVPRTEVANLDTSNWQLIIGQLLLHLIYWVLTDLGCLSLNINAAPTGG